MEKSVLISIVPYPTGKGWVLVENFTEADGRLYVLQRCNPSEYLQGLKKMALSDCARYKFQGYTVTYEDIN